MQHLHFGVPDLAYPECFSVVIDSVSKAVNRTDKLCHCESSSEDKNASREQG